MTDTDFTGNRVLVVGDTSVIGKGSNLPDLTYQQVDVGAPDPIGAASSSFE